MAKRATKNTKAKLIATVSTAVVVIGGIVALTLIAILSGQAPTATIEYSDGTHSAKITLDSGEVQDIDAPTVESVDVNKAQDDVEAEESGRGYWVDVSSPEAFRNSTLGTCINTDGAYGAQCWDLADAFFQSYANRHFSTCGTGSAKGSMNCWQQNAGDEFEMVWNSNDLQAGDIVVFNTGEWGHVGMAMGYSNDGYVTLLGQNQGGGYCDQGGSSTNIINISLRDFAGAFRPKAYIKPAPVPEPEPVSAPDTGIVKKH